MDVGVRELKQNLSRYLERVAKGEVIRVTDRGAPKALLTPLPDAGVFERAERDGWLRPGEPVPPAEVRRSRSTKRTADVLRADRDED